MIKRGIDYTDSSGYVYKAFDLTTEADVPKAYAYCSDTLLDERYINKLTKVDTLYHEATFLHDMIDRAKETHHSTALEAATVAKKIGAKKLLIGHFSARYKDLGALLQEARSVFSNTQIANQGQVFEI